jgi:hypothetical protein
MVQICTKCSRANPPEAVYCFFDGFVLGTGRRNGAPVAAGAQPFASAFVFPSGRACRSFDELALACYEDWTSARELLRKGYLEEFFGALGRPDLAQTSKEAARFPDPDRGLDQLLVKLPTGVLDEPSLKVEPHEVNLGVLGRGPGPERTFSLRLENAGMRLLYGTVNSGEAWLALGQPPGATEKHFQFTHEQTLTVRVRPDRMRASSKPQEGKLLVESNAGSTVLVVRAEAPALPFPNGVLAGARSPRQLAEKAKANAREAAALFECGAVAEWYVHNGWTYPVQGPAASGLGAVQQFFEALGLTPPPKVQISENSVRLQGEPGQTLHYTLEVRTEEKRPVYAHGVSSQPWLEIRKVKLNGNKASIQICIQSVPNEPGETLTAKLAVQSNGKQRFVVPVTLQVGGQFDFSVFDTDPQPVLPPPLPPTRTLLNAEQPRTLPTLATAVARNDRGSQLGWGHIIPAGMLVLALLGVMIWDVVDPAGLGERVQGPAASKAGFGVAYDVQGGPLLDFIYDKYDPREINYRFGLVLLEQKDPGNENGKKRLTFRENGASNSVLVRVEGHDYFYGKGPGQRAFKEQLDNSRHAWKTGWNFRGEGIRVTQIVQIVPGAQSGQLDTCLVRYAVENKSGVPHKVGLRVLLDTYIGGNDGVPFAIPGRPGLLKTPEVFEKDRIPDYVQAMEKPNLQAPGTVAHLGLRGIEIPGSELEPIARMVICPWESDAVGWEIPIAEEGKDKPIEDSCVVLYWQERDMPPGEVREMAYTYGLNALSAPEGAGNLALTVGGSFVSGSEFTATAYVKNPEEGQKVTLLLPQGLSLVHGQDQEQEVKGKGDYSQVSWRIHSDNAGEYLLRATSGLSGVQHKVRISTGSLLR